MTNYLRTGKNVDRGLIGYWELDDLKLNGVSKAIDRVNFNDGTITDVINTEGINGLNLDAMSFNGTTAFVDTGNKSEFNFGTKSFSIACWTKTDFLTSDWIFGKWDSTNTSTGIGYGLSTNKGGSARLLNFNVWDGSSNKTLVVVLGLDASVENKWVHVVGTYNSATNIAKIYINGELKGQSSNASIGSTNNSNSLYIGRNSASHYKGSISLCRLYNRVLTQSTTNKLYRFRL